MNVLSVSIRMNQTFILRHVGQNSKFNLRIIRIYKYIALLWHKHLSNSPSQLHANRNILQIRLCAADTSRCRNGLVEFSMNSAILPDKTSQTLSISRIQLGQLTVFQNHLNNRIFRSQLFKHIRRRRIPCLCLLSMRKLHPLKKDLSQLFGRVNVKRLPGQLVNLLLQLLDLHLQLLSIDPQLFSVHPDTCLLHVIKAVYQRHFHLEEQRQHSLLLQSALQHRKRFPRNISHITGAGNRFLFSLRKCLTQICLSQKICLRGNRHTQIISCQIIIVIRIFQRIQQISGNCPVHNRTAIIQLQIGKLRL